MSIIENWTEFSQQANFKDIPIESFAGKEKWADNFMKEFHSKLKINQLRNFFTEIQRVQKDETIKHDKKKLEESLSLVEMNLAYDFGRNVINRDFYNLIIKSLKKISGEKDFDQFFIFMKSLIAYHKYHSKQN